MSLSQLSRLLPLPEAELQQALDYAATLSKQDAVEHFNNLLGESPQSIEFISSFNARRKEPDSKPAPQVNPAADLSAGVPKASRAPKKKKAPLHTPAARQVQDSYAAPGTAYTKKNEDDYIAKRPTPPRAETPNASTVTTKPEAVQAPVPRAPPSAAGSLISDFKTKSNASSRNASRTSSPAPKTKVNISGGTSMQGASAALNEFDAAIRSLEISTNSSLLDKEKRKCNCIGARHPLLAAAPNCLNCGKVICVKEGLGPCTFCGQPLLTAVEVQSMIRELREERGREKMALDNAGNRRAEVSKKPMPFSTQRNADAGLMSPAEAKAKEHRDKLLAFQAQNAKRTTVRDEAADFETPMMGVSNWASPSERAKQLKKQQKVLAEQEWNARPEYEKRRQVVSIDLVKGKVMKRMAAVERPQVESESEEEVEILPLSSTTGNKGGGTFSRNPLLGGLIKPVYDSSKGKETEGQPFEMRKKAWRRVQDDLDDNEAIILDGGVYGDTTDKRGEEPSCG